MPQDHHLSLSSCPQSLTTSFPSFAFPFSVTRSLSFPMESRNGEASLFSLIFLLCLYTVAALLVVPTLGDGAAVAGGDGQAMYLRLFHRNELEFRPLAREKDDDAALRHLDDLATRDLVRQERMYEMLCSGRRRVTEIDGGLAAVESFQAQISSGAYAGTGEYFVKLRMGTPAKEYLLVADTGSDLTWTKCQHAGPLRRGRVHIFPAVGSASFIPVACSSGMCKSTLPFTLASCPSPVSPCRYDFHYADGSFTRGIYANETVTVTAPDGTVSEIRDVLIGCSSEFQGKAFNRTDGILGLGQSAISFTVTAAQIYGGKFSYCLMDHLSRKNVQNYLVFGKNPRISERRDVRFTPLVLDAAIQPFYGLVVRGISMDGLWLTIPVSVWKFRFSGGTVSNGVIIDSGMTLTTLVKPAYDVVMAAFRGYFRNFRTFNLGRFQLCFNTTELTRRQSRMVGPRMVIHLGGGALFVPHTHSYVVPVAKDVKCVGIVPGQFPGLSVIGNILQQQYVWQFDLLNGRLGFAPSYCRT